MRLLGPRVRPNCSPTARACLGSYDPISRATIDFQSDGSVRNMSVTARGRNYEQLLQREIVLEAVA
jgi:hypothetical protein